MSLFPDVKEEIKNIKNEEKEKLSLLLNETEKYRPSNGCEGSWFEDNICGACKKYWQCKIILDLSFDYVNEIRRYKSAIFCTKHTKFNLNYLEKIIKETK